jgi:hypothetical protein
LCGWCSEKTQRQEQKQSQVTQSRVDNGGIDDGKKKTVDEKETNRNKHKEKRVM